MGMGNVYHGKLREMECVARAIGGSSASPGNLERSLVPSEATHHDYSFDSFCGLYMAHCCCQRDGLYAQLEYSTKEHLQ